MKEKEPDTIPIILVFCPKCEHLFFDVWQYKDRKKIWRDNTKTVAFVCPFCHAHLEPW